MKNKNFIIKYLISLIIILTVFAGTYAFTNRELITNDEKIQTVGDVQEQSNKVVTDNSQAKPSEPIEPVYTSDNARGNYGVKTIDSLAKYEELLARDENIFLVFGRDGCHFCELYEPVLTEVAALYKIEIDYVNLALLTPSDYKDVLSSSLRIPAKCTKNSEDSDISNGFGTPLTLFVRKGETYNCIRGYKDRTNLIKDLKDFGYVN